MRALLLTLALATAAAHADWVNLAEQDFAATWTPVSGTWSSENGIITGTATQDEAAVLLSNADYSNFDLEFDTDASRPEAGIVALRSHWLPQAPKTDSPLPLFGLTFPLHGANSEGGNWKSLQFTAAGENVSTARDTLVVVKGNAFIGGKLALVVSPGDNAQIQFRNIRIDDRGREGTWRRLFNGNDFTGWKIWGTEEWKVEDGVIIGRSGPKKSEGYLATEETWNDFRVRGSFKMLGEGNFGLFYHSTIAYNDEQYPVISGLQGEVAPGYPSPTGWVDESYNRGWLVEPDMNTYRAYALRPGDWNEIEILSIANHITTWVNGIQVLDLTDDNQQLTEGNFALQLHTGGTDGIQWKDLYVLEK